MTANLNRFNALVKLGEYLRNCDFEKPLYFDLQDKISQAIAANGWFTKETVLNALAAWGKVLTKEALSIWIKSHHFSNQSQPKTIALILAGNIPLVGFHDLISVWISGHQALVKCATKDEFLIPFLAELLEKEAGEKGFSFTKKTLAQYDAVIATGSTNSSRYFEYYFSKYPHIIRKNRNGVAVLDGTETETDLKGLGKDILQYFGLGCRNISKLYLPKGYDLNLIFGGLYGYAEVIHHPKYANNYDYNKAVYLMSEYDFLENGFILLRAHPAFSAPIACLHYEYYTNLEELKQELNNHNEQIQCIVSNCAIANKIPFGKTQEPKLEDYADGINTLCFLEKLS